MDGMKIEYIRLNDPNTTYYRVVQLEIRENI